VVLSKAGGLSLLKFKPGHKGLSIARHMRPTRISLTNWPE
jgi:hypothetical protein